MSLLRRDGLVSVLFALTLFASAALLFCVEPMIAKMILPLLGGSPAVWNTCMVFFQAAMLVGYLAAHVLVTRLPVRGQVLLYLGVLALPAAVVLPIAVPGWALQAVPSGDNPIPWLLGVLLVSVGLPFFAMATTAPVLQKWFAGTDHPAGRDPYFLYSASNLGSVLGLLGYPLVVERYLPLSQQSGFWAAGYALLVLLAAACAVTAWRTRKTAGGRRQAEQEEPAVAAPPSPLAPTRRLRWLVLAFVPSSLFLAVTLYITTDLAPIPLLWVIPLGLYLLSFILAFARRPLIPHQWVSRAVPVVVLLVTFLILSGGNATGKEWIPVHLLALFVVALYCHGELALDRPPADRLTEFYLYLAAGGVLGGLFNGLLVPVLFRHVGLIVEYPLALLAGCALQPPRLRAKPREGRERGDRTPGWRGPVSFFSNLWPRQRWFDLVVPLGLGAVPVAFFLTWKVLGRPPSTSSIMLMFGILAAACYALVDRPVRFALSLGAIMLAYLVLIEGGRLRYTERNFFGVIRVVDTADGEFRQMVHGNTVHGMQGLDPERRDKPLFYYYPTSPVAQVFGLIQSRPAAARVAVVGLGVGSLAGYGQPGEDWTFYEIDPAVLAVSGEGGYFTHLRDCRAHVRVVLGDARLRLREAPDHSYDLIVLDAFSSDAVPTHLLTREAVALYERKLAPHGVVTFNLSNRYLNLRPVLAAVAEQAEPRPLVCFGRDDLDVSAEEARDGKSPSVWLALARDEGDLERIARDARWRRLRSQPTIPPWTDDYSNIFSVFNWR
jgi:spermidine synthase